MKTSNTLAKYENDYNELINLFFPTYEASCLNDISLSYLQKDKSFEIDVEINGKIYTYEHMNEEENNIAIKKYIILLIDKI